MSCLTWEEAQELKRFYHEMVADVNQSFSNSGLQIAGLLVVPQDLDGMQDVFNQFLVTGDTNIDEKTPKCENCCVIAVIKDETTHGQPFYFFKQMQNILV